MAACASALGVREILDNILVEVHAIPNDGFYWDKKNRFRSVIFDCLTVNSTWYVASRRILWTSLPDIEAFGQIPLERRKEYASCVRNLFFAVPRSADAKPLGELLLPNLKELYVAAAYQEGTKDAFEEYVQYIPSSISTLILSISDMTSDFEWDCLALKQRCVELGPEIKLRPSSLPTDPHQFRELGKNENHQFEEEIILGFNLHLEKFESLKVLHIDGLSPSSTPTAWVIPFINSSLEKLVAPLQYDPDFDLDMNDPSLMSMTSLRHLTTRCHIKRLPHLLKNTGNLVTLDLVVVYSHLHEVEEYRDLVVERLFQSLRLNKNLTSFKVEFDLNRLFIAPTYVYDITEEQILHFFQSRTAFFERFSITASDAHHGLSNITDSTIAKIAELVPYCKTFWLDARIENNAATIDGFACFAKAAPKLECFGLEETFLDFAQLPKFAGQPIAPNLKYLTFFSASEQQVAEKYNDDNWSETWRNRFNRHLPSLSYFSVNWPSDPRRQYPCPLHDHFVWEILSDIPPHPTPPEQFDDDWDDDWDDNFPGL